MSARGLLRLGEHADLSASWGLWRDQRFCDTCGDGQGPGALGDELLGSSDLTISAGRSWPLGKGKLRLAGLATLPASRDALFCNPMFGAPGLSAVAIQPLARTSLRASLQLQRPLYRFSTAPVGGCAPPLRGANPVDTLTGAVDPEPWAGSRTAGPNPTLTSTASVVWVNPHALWGRAPKPLTSLIVLGLKAQRNPRQSATSVPTLTGVALLDRGRAPFTGSVPWTVAVGLQATKRTDLQFSLANQLPTWLADPGGTLRALPARSSVTLQLRHRLGGSQDADPVNPPL